ncbi:vWA domain-containing protein [Cryptosporangium aurantiacum]|uniref:Mg-chelatase subunit ChlD n=1 Tax=Cryptosporangium aurantiacum TaxID=134849 RepID=A0A1M7RJ45_9ACTN|nr:VWA domain-containing protein [Cryptosporangium aurantiacum]SHN46172.1 Mg-chelatase subunit ChlD [Cryptosporangium aurantiacum]
MTANGADPSPASGGEPRPPQTDDRESVIPWPVYLGAFVLASCAIGGVAAATDTPDSGVAWLVLILAAMLGGVPATGATYAALRPLFKQLKPGWKLPKLPKPRAQPSWVWRFLLPGLGVVVALSVAASIPGVRAYVDFQLYGCRPPPPLRVLTTPESLEATSALATAYERASAAARKGCRAADLYVYAADPAEVRRTLLSGWSLGDIGDIGPRPDVWLPDSMVEPARVRAEADRTGSKSPVDSTRALATTPVVLGIPAELAAEGPAGRWTERTWAELLAETDEAKLPIVRPDPTGSATGEIATELIYRSLEKAKAQAKTEIDLRALERRIGRDLDSGSYPIGDASALLCRRRTAPSTDRSAVILTEQQLVRYNQGLPLGDRCPTQARESDIPKLVAVYPSDTAGLDHPFVSLRWPDGTDRQTRAARAWGDWLGTAEGLDALADLGLRPESEANGPVPVVEPLVTQWGARPDAVFVRKSPQTAHVEDAREKYAQANRPARTLVLLDASGSMNTLDSTGRSTRFNAASAALRIAFGQVAQQDEVGLRTFSSDGASADLIVKIAVPARNNAAVVEKELKRIRPSDGTPLYRAVDDGLTELGAPDPDRVTSLIVITDGENTERGPRPDALKSEAIGSKIRVSVVALGEADCAGPALHMLADNTGGRCVDAEPQTLAPTLVGLFAAVGGGTDGD